MTKSFKAIIPYGPVHSINGPHAPGQPPNPKTYKKKMNYGDTKTKHNYDMVNFHKCYDQLREDKEKDAQEKKAAFQALKDKRRRPRKKQSKTKHTKKGAHPPTSKKTSAKLAPTTTGASSQTATGASNQTPAPKIPTEVTEENQGETVSAAKAAPSNVEEEATPPTKPSEETTVTTKQPTQNTVEKATTPAVPNQDDVEVASNINRMEEEQQEEEETPSSNHDEVEEDVHSVIELLDSDSEDEVEHLDSESEDEDDVQVESNVNNMEEELQEQEELSNSNNDESEVNIPDEHTPQGDDETEDATTQSMEAEGVHIVSPPPPTTSESESAATQADQSTQEEEDSDSEEEDNDGDEEDDGYEEAHIPPFLDDALESAMTVLKCAVPGTTFKSKGVNTPVVELEIDNIQPAWDVLKKHIKDNAVNKKLITFFCILLQCTDNPDELTNTLAKSLATSIDLFKLTYTPQLRDATGITDKNDLAFVNTKN